VAATADAALGCNRCGMQAAAAAAAAGASESRLTAQGD
jgi:hypothetical protein